MIKCFYHNDLDGQCAAYWVLVAMGDVELMEIDYRDPFPIDQITAEDVVWLVDYSTDQMEELKKKCSRLVWIDHHKTAIDQYDPDIIGVRVSGIAACELTHQYLFPQVPVAPKFTRLIGDWDVWKFVYEDTRPFHYGMGLYPTKPRCNIWTQLAEDHDEGFLDTIVDSGYIIMKYLAQSNKNYLDAYSYRCTLDGHFALVCNKAGGSSEFFRSSPGYPLYISYVHDGKKYRVSLYSTVIDVGELAKQHGGGGHRGAAGFICEELPWQVEP